jgi:hypothetical protein
MQNQTKTQNKTLKKLLIGLLLVVSFFAASGQVVLAAAVAENNIPSIQSAETDLKTAQAARDAAYQTAWNTYLDDTKTIAQDASAENEPFSQTKANELKKQRNEGTGPFADQWAILEQARAAADKKVADAETALATAKATYDGNFATDVRELCKMDPSFTVDLQAPLVREPTDAGFEGKVQEFKGACFVFRGKWYQLVSGADGGDILSNYAKYIYRFLAGTVGLLSVLMLVVGGIQISMAGASQEGVQGGKDRIYGALAGLTILFLASLILYTINPNFFKL